MSNTNQKSGSYVSILIILGVMYFVLGFATWLNGPLITFVKLAFRLDDINAFLVPMVFYMSYLFLALPSSWLLKRTGMKTGMAIGLLIMAAGAAIFGQFATMRIYPGALSGLFVIGAGLAILQTAVNPYVSIVGPIESAAQRIAIMGICNKIAGILAPFVIAAVVLQGIGQLDQQVQAAASPAAREALLSAFAAKIHTPYLVMALLLALLALFVARSPLPEINTADDKGTGVKPSRGLWSVRHLWLGVICLFLYVGVEVMAGDAIGTYGQSFHLPPDQTKFFTSFTLAAMLLGYLSGLIFVPRVISQERYLALSAVLGVGLVVGAYLTQGYASVACVAALGFANAMMWPAIFPLAIKGLGDLTERGSAILIMGIAGGAVLPQLFVNLKAHFDFQLVFLAIMAPAYLYILFFATLGHKDAAANAAPNAALTEKV